MEYNGIVLADIHIGVMNYEETYKEYMYLKNYIDQHGKFDYAIIAGDLFDRRLYTNEKVLRIAYLIMILLLVNSKKLRIVNGTKSHDNEQYNLFLNMGNLLDGYKQNYDFRIIYTVEEEELFPDLNVLYIPEEYIYDKKSYYEEFLLKNKKYDYVFGHGVIAEVMTNAVRHTKESTSKRKKPPVFTTAELKNICKGKVYFGHYHIHTNIDDKIFYVGSYSRFRFGEEEPKGFYITNYKDGEYSETFIENTHALKYVTLAYGYDSDIFKNENNLIDEMNNVIKNKKRYKVDKLRLMLNIPENCPIAEFIIDFMSNKFRLDDSVKVEIVNGYIENKKLANKEIVEDVFTKYAFMFDKSLDVEDQLSQFIKIDHDKEIAPEKIKKYLVAQDINALITE